MIDIRYYVFFIRFTITAFVIIGAVLLFGSAEWFPDFYNPTFMGVWALISALLIVAPVVLFKSDDPKKMRAAVGLQMGLTLALIFNGFGALGLYQLFKLGIPYDKIVHFLSSLILTVSFANFVWLWFGIHSKKLVVFVLFFALLVGIGWEGLEFSLDFLFGTNTLGINGEYIIWDSTVDIIMDILGILFGFLIFIHKIHGKSKFRLLTNKL